MPPQQSPRAEEQHGSPSVTFGPTPKAELFYLVYGATNYADAVNLVLRDSPSTFDLYGDGSVLLDRLWISRLQPARKQELWEASVEYGTPGAAGSPQEPNTIETSFEVAGTRERIFRAISQSRYPATAPDHFGVIGMTGDDVEGVDILVPVFRFVETWVAPGSAITQAYINTLQSLTGKVNNATFRGFAAGEVLLTGVQGQKRADGYWDVRYLFEVRKNETNVQFGSIVVPEIKGWEYAEPLFEKKEDTSGKAMVLEPVAVYVNQIYETGDFSLLGIGT